MTTEEEKKAPRMTLDEWAAAQPPAKFIQIAATGSHGYGQVWALDLSGRVWRLNGDYWLSMPLKRYASLEDAMHAGESR